VFLFPPALAELMAVANRRHLDDLPCLDDPSAGLKDLDKLVERVHESRTDLPGFNLLARTEGTKETTEKGR
jgi:hypothetical protein